MGWVYIYLVHVNLLMIGSLQMDMLATSNNPDKMQLNAAFYQDLHYLEQNLQNTSSIHYI